MSAADHPTWMRIRTFVITPPLYIRIVTRAAFPLAVMYLTRNTLALAAAIAGPYIVVSAIDIYLHSRFTLRGLLLAILTLQIPIVILVTHRSPLGIGIAIALLLAWSVVMAVRLKLIGTSDSSQAGRWKKIDPNEPSL